ncbi:hypothetical protein [Amaricoccus macauensis]|uniref:hypothetical protein n=1 Tax=Amaricoccus macauensis TaxID=57001 RepID=UPI003C7C86FF
MAILSEDFSGPSFFANAIKSIGNALVAMGNASQPAKCAALAERLQAKSDEELAELGIARDEIVRYAFARYM